MKVIIEERLYEGTPVEIMERLREENFDPDECPDVDSYISMLRHRFETMTERVCNLPSSSTERRAAVMIDRLESIGALRKLVA